MGNGSVLACSREAGARKAMSSTHSQDGAGPGTHQAPGSDCWGAEQTLNSGPPLRMVEQHEVQVAVVPSPAL